MGSRRVEEDLGLCPAFLHPPFSAGLPHRGAPTSSPSVIPGLHSPKPACPGTRAVSGDMGHAGEAPHPRASGANGVCSCPVCPSYLLLCKLPKDRSPRLDETSVYQTWEEPQWIPIPTSHLGTMGKFPE